MGYESRLFDTSRVHTIDLVLDGWEEFLETCEDEEYVPCAVVVDGEAYQNVGLRAKGNTSLSMVSSLGSDRYSFKLEFDQYETGRAYHGLDKLCLNNLIQDNTMMKDYLVYRLMAQFGAVSPLCSFVFLTVNGEDWGLYLAVEGVEDSFLQRNYGAQHGELYKPDSMSFGGGRGNGRDFNMEGFGADGGFQMPDIPQDGPQMPDGMPRDGRGGDRGMAGGPGGGMGAGDVKLQYAGDDPDSYANIFDSAKTDVSAADQARLIRALKALGEGDADQALDVDAVLRYLVVHNYVVNGDSYTGSMVHNYYLYEEDGLLSMLPWDYNLAFGTFQGNDAASAVNDSIDAPLSVTGDGDRPMADWVTSSQEYTQLYHRYFAEFLETADPAALIDEAYALIAPYVERDPTKFCTFGEFELGVQALKTFCALRTESVSAQLAGEEGQVDASGLDLSAMGTMNRGGGFPGRDNGASAPAFRPEGGFTGGRPEDGGVRNPGGERLRESAAPAQTPDRAAEALLAGSILALLLGLAAAFRYRRFRA